MSTIKFPISAASFLVASSKNVEALRIPFSGGVLEDVHKSILEQFATFRKLEPIEFSGQYQTGPEECLYIENYADTDKTMASFIDIVEGKSSKTLDKADDFDKCRSLLFTIPEFPDLILIQKFSRIYVASKRKWLGFFGASDGRVVNYIDESAFSIASKLAGYYDRTKNILYFQNLESIQRALPGFSEKYIPEADAATMAAFFSKGEFDQASVKQFGSYKSVRVARLVWLLSKKDIKGQIDKLKNYNEKLNIGCISPDGKIVLQKEIQKMVVILRILNNDVFESKEGIYMANSKRALKPFPSANTEVK